jgi:electron transfer flavoprotein beta subunit
LDIIVCVKQVPETAEVDLEILDSGRGIETKGLVFEMNEWDEYALEEALLIKEKLGGTVTAVTMGPEGADAVLRRCLAKGADKAVWLRDEAFHASDAYATAMTLRAALRDLEYDLIFTGAQASDDGYSSVGVILAELLSIPHASMVKKVEVDGERISVNRELEGGLEEVVELETPALLAIQTGINEPRYVSIMGIRRARKKEMTTMGLGGTGLASGEVGEAGSWMRVERVYRPPVEKEPEFLEGGPEEVVTKLVEVLRARGLV